MDISVRKFAVAALAGGMLLAPLGARAAVTFGYLGIGGYATAMVRGQQNQGFQFQNYPHRWKMLMGGANLTANAAASTTGSSDSAAATAEVTLNNKSSGTYTLQDSALMIDNVGRTIAAAYSGFQYIFTLSTAGTYDITLHGSVGGFGNGTRGNYETELRDLTSNSTLYTDVAGVGDSFTQTISGLGNGTYMIETFTMDPTMVKGIACGCAKNAATFGTFTFSMVDPPGPVGSSFPSSGLVVPEPETWALMMLGVGGAGVALRRRRRHEAATVLA